MIESDSLSAPNPHALGAMLLTEFAPVLVTRRFCRKHCREPSLNHLTPPVEDYFGRESIGSREKEES